MEGANGSQNSKKEFCTPLSIAVAHGQLEVAQLLVRKKADPTLVVNSHQKPVKSRGGLIAKMRKKTRKQDKKQRKFPRPSPYEHALLRLNDAMANSSSDGLVRMKSAIIEKLPSVKEEDINFKQSQVMCKSING